MLAAHNGQAQGGEVRCGRCRSYCQDGDLGGRQGVLPDLHTILCQRAALSMLCKHTVSHTADKDTSQQQLWQPTSAVRSYSSLARSSLTAASCSWGLGPSGNPKAEPLTSSCAPSCLLARLLAHNCGPWCCLGPAAACHQQAPSLAEDCKPPTQLAAAACKKPSVHVIQQQHRLVHLPVHQCEPGPTCTAACRRC